MVPCELNSFTNIFLFFFVNRDQYSQEKDNLELEVSPIFWEVRTLSRFKHSFPHSTKHLVSTYYLPYSINKTVFSRLKEKCQNRKRIAMSLQLFREGILKVISKLLKVGKKNINPTDSKINGFQNLIFCFIQERKYAH